MATRDADAPPTGVRAMATVAQALPARPGGPAGSRYLPCPGWARRARSGCGPCRGSPDWKPFA